MVVGGGGGGLTRKEKKIRKDKGLGMHMGREKLGIEIAKAVKCDGGRWEKE